MDLHTPLPKSWEQFVSLKELLKTTDRGVLRLPEDNEYYTLFRQVVAKDVQLELIKKQLKGQELGILVNRFPYTRLLTHLPNVHQYCLWSLKGNLSESEVEKIVEQKFPESQWFASESEFKSVPEIWHTHVFVKNTYER